MKMNSRSTTDMIRQLVFTAHKLRNASTTTLPRPPKPIPEHGQHIFVFNHLQTNQVVYSLTKNLKNNAAIRQLPFNGKKTVPRALRKDLWSPLATISFPPGSGALGLSTFQKLRELRHLHETLWDPSEMVEEVEYEDGTKVTKPLSRKDRGRKLMDQKANSVADMACVLGAIGTQHGEGWGLKGGEAGKAVEIRWRNLGDAEFAATWEGNVVHDLLGRSGEIVYGRAVEEKEEKRRLEEERQRIELEAKDGKENAIQSPPTS